MPVKKTGGWVIRKPWKKDIRRVSAERIWQMRSISRKSLIDYARNRLSVQLEASGATPENVDKAKLLFNPDALTLGFARRFAPIKAKPIVT